jgi:hypothetical protein
MSADSLLTGENAACWLPRKACAAASSRELRDGRGDEDTVCGPWMPIHDDVMGAHFAFG